MCATLRKASRSVTQLYDNMLRPSGLRSTQFHILAEVYGAGEATVSELAKRLVIDQTTLTRGLALLERDGLLKSNPKPDARLKAVQLTKKGEQTLMAALPLWKAAQQQMLELIGPAAWPLLAADIERITASLSA